MISLCVVRYGGLYAHEPSFEGCLLNILLAEQESYRPGSFLWVALNLWFRQALALQPSIVVCHPGRSEPTAPETAWSCSVGDLGLIPGLGRSPREGKGYPLQHSGLENSMDCIVHGVPKSQTWLSDFHFIFNEIIYINNYLKCKWTKCCNQKTQVDWMDTGTWPLYILSTRDQPQN